MVPEKIVALLTDFGTEDHFAATMKAVMLGIDPRIRIFDISHRIQPQNILEAAFTLSDTLPYWPENTLFVAVVDPGVGTERKSVATVLNTGHHVVCPDNGLLTLIDKTPGIKTIRLINEKEQRRPGSEDSHTFHGRDIYAWVAGRLAAGKIVLEELGPEMEDDIVKLKIEDPGSEDEYLKGTIVKVERPFGNLSTNLEGSFIFDSNIQYGDNVRIRIFEEDELRFEKKIKFVPTFNKTMPGEPLAYIDSSGRLGLSVNQGDFSKKYAIKSGSFWVIQIGRSE